MESNEASVRDLRANAEAAAASVTALVQDTERYLASCKESPDLIVLDPPRAGVGSESVRNLLRIAPRRLAYLSCDPSTLARDLAGLLAPGAAGPRYAIREVHLLDVFPQTFHIESLIRLELA